MRYLKFIVKYCVTGISTGIILLFLVPGFSGNRDAAMAFLEKLHGPESYAYAAAEAGPAVVNIYTKASYKSSYPEQNYGMESKSGESSLNPVGLGSGIIMDSSGHIITNYHVIKDAEQIIVAIQDGRIFTAKLIGVDLLTDLAVVKIDAENLPVIPTNDDLTPRVGDVVLAIGNPFNVGQTVTQGIISATGRSGLGTMGPNTRGRQDLLQSDVSINSGNSGGALVNTRGELVGIASGQYQRGSASGESDSTGISFAIPYKLAKRIMGELIKNGKVTRGYLGISTVDIDPISAELFNISGNEGLIIRDVEPSGPAAEAGLQAGDIITRIDSTDITAAHVAMDLIAETRPGQVIKVTVRRGKGVVTVPVRVAEDQVERQVN